MTKSKILLCCLIILAALFALVTGVNSAKKLVIIDEPQPAQNKATATHSTSTSAVSPQQPSNSYVHPPKLDTHSKNPGEYHTQQRHHDHDHSDQSIQIPVEINAYIESKRIPKQQLKPVKNPDGSYSLNPQGQFETVSIAVIGEDGKVHITERQIQPRADSSEKE
ncbi:hypothetical protein [Bacterioplanoides sp.]|uniref:hypothetical protein n=1 Tax=Bacterioplanoides sp. TaxID=2066072 RepID=UPI003AFFA60E